MPSVPLAAILFGLLELLSSVELLLRCASTFLSLISVIECRLVFFLDITVLVLVIPRLHYKTIATHATAKMLKCSFERMLLGMISIFMAFRFLCKNESLSNFA